MQNYLFMVRADSKSWPKPAASHNHTLLDQVANEVKSAIISDITDCNTFVDPKVDPEVDPKVHVSQRQTK